MRPLRARHRLVRAVLLLLALAWAALTVSAHPMPESRVWVDSTPTGLTLTLQLPLNRLEHGYGQPLSNAPDTVLARHGDGLARYLLLHVGARSGGAGEGAGWQALRPQLQVLGDGETAELQAVMALQAPPGADPRQLTLLYDAVTHEVRTHRVQVFLRTDWAGGFVGAAPLPLGELQHDHPRLPITLAAARPGSSLWRLLQDGALHIAEGTDHLLFLLLLLVVAPLSMAAGRWTEPRTPRAALRHTAWVVSAFTLGHTLTLVLGSTGVLTLPAQAVEVAVALTIAVAAVHAWRPLFAQGEARMALAFGLVHGMAFSASLSGAGLGVAQHALALLAFNLGIEGMQLLLLAAVLPPLVLIARQAPRHFDGLRRTAAVASLGVAGLWIAERLGADPWSAWPWLEAGAPAFRWLPVALWLGAGLAWRPG
jgi:hypothetical protein